MTIKKCFLCRLFIPIDQVPLIGICTGDCDHNRHVLSRHHLICEAFQGEFVGNEKPIEDLFNAYHEDDAFESVYRSAIERFLREHK